MLRVEVSQIFQRPIPERLTLAVVAVLKDEKTGIVLGTHHEGVQALLIDSAGVLSA